MHDGSHANSAGLSASNAPAFQELFEHAPRPIGQHTYTAERIQITANQQTLRTTNNILKLLVIRIAETGIRVNVLHIASKQPTSGPNTCVRERKGRTKDVLEGEASTVSACNQWQDSLPIMTQPYEGAKYASRYVHPQSV